MNSSAWAALAAVDDLVDRSRRAARRRCSRGPSSEKRNGVVEHHADVRPQRQQRDVPDVVPVDQHVPVAHVVEAGHQAGDGRLAVARAADDGHGLAGLHREVEAVEDVGAVLAVPEPHVAELDPAVDLGEVDRVRLVLHLGRLVEQLEDAIGRGCGPLLHHHEEAEQPERRLHHQDVGVERDEHADLQLAVDHEDSRRRRGRSRARVGAGSPSPARSCARVYSSVTLAHWSCWAAGRACGSGAAPGRTTSRRGRR